MKFVKLVAVKFAFPKNGKNYLFVAPFLADMNAGDEVIVDTAKGEQRATVVSFTDVRDGGDEYKFIISAMGATIPLKKVLARLTMYRYMYEEDGNGTDQG